MFRSILRRLLWTYILILAIVFTVIFCAMAGFYLNYSANTLYKDVSRSREHISRMTMQADDGAYTSQMKNFYDVSLQNAAKIAGADITVVDSDGNIYSSTASITSVPHDILKTAASGEVVRKYAHFDSHYGGSMVYTIALPMDYNGVTVGVIFYTTTMSELFSDFGSFAFMLLLSFLISAVVAILLIFIQTRKITKPIADINSAVLAIASGKFDRRLPVKSADETGQLSSSFNYMAESLEELENMRESFISDVSHELRTPMTSISGFVGGILDGTIPEDKHKEYLTLVLEESKRLSKMTSDMLEMSKMSSSEYKLDMKKFDICELVRLAIISLENKIEKKSLDLDVSFAHTQINVLADRDSILRVIINLLDNAVKFSFDNTKITISAWCDSQTAYVSVGNFGIGIEDKDLPHIFDRFYKTDKSRGKDKSGAGLGLSMSKNIMNLHNMNIWATSEAPKEGSNLRYTTFTFSLELA